MVFMEWTYQRNDEVVTISLGAGWTWRISFGTVNSYGYHWKEWHDLGCPGEYHDWLIAEGFEAV